MKCASLPVDSEKNGAAKPFSSLSSCFITLLHILSSQWHVESSWGPAALISSLIGEMRIHRW